MKFSRSLLALSLFAPAATGFYVSSPVTRYPSSALNAFNFEPGKGVQSSKTVGAPGGAPSGPLQNTVTTPQSPQSGESKDLWDVIKPTVVQGNSLRTWAFDDGRVERVQVLMKTEGRPLNSNIELWEGPDNTPQRVAVYIEDAALRPFSAVICTPRGYSSVSIYNTGHLEFPVNAIVEPETRTETYGLGEAIRNLGQKADRKTIQGGAIHTKTFSPSVASVQVLLQTDGRPLNARVELLQGPNNIKQVMELYTEDGLERPFFTVMDTPGNGNVIRIVNTATVEFPITASVEPYAMEAGAAYTPDDGEWDKSSNSFGGSRGDSFFFLS